MAKTKYYEVWGEDSYGGEAYLKFNKDPKTGKVHIYLSEEGDPVVMLNKQVKELIEKLKQSLKGEI